MFVSFLHGCSPLDSDGVVEVLDKKIVQGCYEAGGLPPIRIRQDSISSEDRIIYPSYEFVTHGRQAAEVVFAEPRILIEKTAENSNGYSYNFGDIVDENGATGYYVLRSEKKISLSVISIPDYNSHIYTQVPCL